MTEKSPRKDSETLPGWELSEMVDDIIDEVDQANDMSNHDKVQSASMMKATCSISHHVSISHSHSASISAANNKSHEQQQLFQPQQPQTSNGNDKNTNLSTKTTNEKTLGKIIDNYNYNGNNKATEEGRSSSSLSLAVASKKHIKTQLAESFKDSQIVVATCDTILQRIAIKYNWHDDTQKLIYSFLTSKTFGIIYFSLFWMRVIIYGLFGKSTIIGIILVLMYYCCQLGVMTILNYRFLIFNITQFEAAFKCANSIIFSIHFYLLESTQSVDFQSILFCLTLAGDTFFAINAPCLRTGKTCKLLSLFVMILMCAYGYANAYYLVNLNYYIFAWAGLNDDWTKEFRDFEYKVLGSTISTRSMVMSSTTNLIIFFAKQMYDKVKFPNSVMYLTPYKIHYRSEDNVDRGE